MPLLSPGAGRSCRWGTLAAPWSLLPQHQSWRGWARGYPQGRGPPPRHRSPTSHPRCLHRPAGAAPGWPGCVLPGADQEERREGECPAGVQATGSEEGPGAVGPQRLGSGACLSCDPELTCWRQAEQGGDLGESGTGAGGGRRWREHIQVSEFHPTASARAGDGRGGCSEEAGLTWLGDDPRLSPWAEAAGLESVWGRTKAGVSRGPPASAGGGGPWLGRGQTEGTRKVQGGGRHYRPVLPGPRGTRLSLRC